jgi:hypothetical protein
VKKHLDLAIRTEELKLENLIQKNMVECEAVYD